MHTQPRKANCTTVTVNSTENLNTYYFYTLCDGALRSTLLACVNFIFENTELRT